MTSPQIVVVGSLNADLLVRVPRHPLPGETLIGSGGDVSPGGKGANQAVAAGRLGGDVALVGAVGTDGYAEAALAELRDAGTALDAVRGVPGPTGLAVVTVDDAGENSIIVIPGANAAVDADAVDAAAGLIESARTVVLQGEIPRSGIERAARLCRGRLIHNPAPVMRLDPEVLLAADPLVVNEHEARLVAEQLAADGTGADGPPSELLSVLVGAGVRSVVMTLGAQGALVADGSAAPVTVPATVVDVVDTTGAGDAFIGALAVGLTEGGSLVSSAELATRVSGWAVGRYGAQRSFPRAGDALPALSEPSGPEGGR